MLKLNLLPPNIYEPRKKRAWFAVFVVVWIALAAGLVAWQLSLVNHKSQKAEELQQQEAIVRQVEQTEEEARNTKAMVAPMLARVQLADEVKKQNLQYPKLYREVRRWTINTVRYDAMAVPQGVTLQARAMTRNLDEMARYLQVMLSCPLFTGVSISWGSAGGTTTPGGMGMPTMGGTLGGPYGGYGMTPAPGGQMAQQPAEGVVFTVVASLREPLFNQVQQYLAMLGGTGMAAGGFRGGFGTGFGTSMPGAPMMGGPPMGGPMMGGPMMGGPPAPTMGGPAAVGGGGPPAGGPAGLGGRGAAVDL